MTPERLSVDAVQVRAGFAAVGVGPVRPAGTLGAVMQAGQRFEDPSQIDFLGIWDDVRKGAYDAGEMIRENEEDGIWGSVLQPSQGLFWYRVPDSELLSEICRCYNDWMADFCTAAPDPATQGAPADIPTSVL